MELRIFESCGHCRTTPKHKLTDNISTEKYDNRKHIDNYKFIHSDLKVAKELVYDKCGFDLTDPKLNSESSEYGACSFGLNGKKIQHRVSKITPTKTGQFVAIWKRNKDGITEPFSDFRRLRFYNYHIKK
jgi:hypothetical protein